MKSITDINEQMHRLQSALTALNTMNATVQSIMIMGKKPVIRIAKNSHCVHLFEQGKANYTYIGHDNTGRFCQGAFELHGCRIIWSDSLH